MGCLHPFYIDSVDAKTGLPTRFLVPCGKCESCLKKKQSDWISRLYVECQMSLSAFFITLTYDEAHLPFPEGVNRKDVQLFFKSFRKEYHDFKHFLVSEYGAVSSRPHYHCLLFFRCRVDWILLSQALERCWKQGGHKIGTVDLASISYVCKYCLKSKSDPRHLYVNRTFSSMSKSNRFKPDATIGYDLLKLASQFSERDCFEVVSGDMVVSMPRYYRDKIFSKAQKLRHANDIQEKYNTPEYLRSVLSANERYNKHLRFERKQREM